MTILNWGIRFTCTIFIVCLILTYTQQRIMTSAKMGTKSFMLEMNENCLVLVKMIQMLLDCYLFGSDFVTYLAVKTRSFV